MGNRHSISTETISQRSRASVSCNEESGSSQPFAAQCFRQLAQPGTKTLLQQTWPTDFSELYELGLELSEVMGSLVCKSWDFPNSSVKLRSEKELQGALRNQSLRFVRVLQLAMTNCENLPQMRYLMHKVGGRTLFAGLENSERMLFKESVIAVMQKRIDQQNALGLDEKKQALDAWDTVAAFIAQQWNQPDLDGSRRKSTPY